MAVWSPDWEFLGLLGKFRSVIWEEKAFSPGSFSVEAPASPEALDLLAPDNLIWFTGETAGVVECWDTAADETGVSVTAKGRLLSGLLDRRILWGTYSLTGTPQAIMTALVEDCAVNPTRGDSQARRMPRLGLREPQQEGESIRKQKTGGSLSEALEELGEAGNVAFGVAFHPQEAEMEFWTRRGVDRTVGQTETAPVFFSAELDDVLTSEYAYNSGEARNVALVAGEGEGPARAYVVVPEGEAPAGVGFIPSGSSAVLLTSDGRELLARAGSAADASAYLSAYTGAQIDQAVGQVLNGGGGVSGVSSFCGRTGAVESQKGDYTAGMVGAATMEEVHAAIQAAISGAIEEAY